ncbi:pentapeptide repeat-containing protein [Gloeothece verrucosa]|uniref:Uncharacterized low-complexity protein-like protein n=1 Tax=Gloeothece verrucosa (strain PCC 7822) TaxID=497965 RepID=E0UGU2_GLOV7|nr:pentapeptide repeat-containing protein [Gloeothece verrucosa]ADN14423.1 Uncharacterized low-complexity protein-like protein [Gloeothece verrucosa PCC 7822]
MVPNRNRMSLYQDAKASFKSLVGQSVIVFVGLIVMLLLTGRKPSGFIVGLSFVVGVGFVAWSEARRLTEFESAEEPEDLEPPQRQQTQTVKPSTVKELLRLCQLDKSRIDVNQQSILRVLLSKNISDKELQRLTLEVVQADQANFVKLAEIAGLSLAEDLKGANLSCANLSGVNLSGAYLIGAYLIGADLIGADLSCAILSGADLSRAILSGADLSCAILSGAYLGGANLSGANLFDAYLFDAYLGGADLSGVNVENAQFGDNEGIDEILKQDLIRRGAIFIDSPGYRSRVTTSR